jgi:hypothetical protein
MKTFIIMCVVIGFGVIVKNAPQAILPILLGLVAIALGIGMLFLGLVYI